MSPHPPQAADPSRASLEELARAVLRRAPSRGLAIGWEVEFGEPWRARSEEALSAGNVSGGLFDAFLWRLTSPPSEDLVGQLREVLDGTARGVVAVPTVPTEEGGHLPGGGQEDLREAVRTLSEHRFAIQREQQVEVSAGDDAGRWTFLVTGVDDYSIRSYREGDEQAILDLFPKCFFVERSREHWNWKYLENPWGRQTLSVALAPTSGDLAAHYAGYPMPLWLGEGGRGRRFLALQMGDTMTHPDHRHVGRGPGSLLARTVRHFFALQRGERFGFFYGFNTGPIQRFCNWFIGGSRVEPVAFWVREGNSVDSVAGYRVQREQTVDGSFDRLFRRAAPKYGFLVARDAKYVDWRYLQCPDDGMVLFTARRWGRLVGWSVFQRRGERLLWGDAFFDRRHGGAARAILSKALSWPAHSGVERVEAWFSERPPWWHEIVTGLGFERQPHPDGLSMMALPDTENTAVDRLQDLYYTLGDGDLF